MPHLRDVGVEADLLEDLGGAVLETSERSHVGQIFHEIPTVAVQWGHFLVEAREHNASSGPGNKATMSPAPRVSPRATLNSEELALLHCGVHTSFLWDSGCDSHSRHFSFHALRVSHTK